MRIEKIEPPEKCKEKIEALCNELLLDRRFGAVDMFNITNAVYITCVSQIARFSAIPRADILLAMEALMIDTKNEIAKVEEKREWK